MILDESQKNSEEYQKSIDSEAWHQIEDSGDWLQLFDEDNFVESSVRVIKNLETIKLRELQKGARLFAESTLDWSKSVDILDGLLSKQS